MSDLHYIRFMDDAKEVEEALERKDGRIAELEVQAHNRNEHISDLEAKVEALRKENQDLRLQLITALVPDGYKESE